MSSTPQDPSSTRPDRTTSPAKGRRCRDLFGPGSMRFLMATIGGVLMGAAGLGVGLLFAVGLWLVLVGLGTFMVTAQSDENA